MERYGVALFYSTQDAMEMEAATKERQMKIRIIPTPEKIYASCGFSLKYTLGDEGALAALLQEKKIQCEGFYHARQEGLTVTYEQIKELQ
ncbi:MAG: DUF3343 domain-containing protein [Veillonellales bacterium]